MWDIFLILWGNLLASAPGKQQTSHTVDYRLVTPPGQTLGQLVLAQIRCGRSLDLYVSPLRKKPRICIMLIPLSPQCVFAGIANSILHNDVGSFHNI